ncbi:MAG: radical SAM protein [Verrucomicrobiota bacterium]
MKEILLEKKREANRVNIQRRVAAGSHKKDTYFEDATLRSNKSWQDALQKSDPELPRVLYLHIPFSKRRCTFCPFFINRNSKNLLEQYVQALIQEIKITSRLEAATAKPIEAIYIGGGTPSDLPSPDVEKIMDTVRANFALAPACEITMEARTHGVDREIAQNWVNSGVNRILMSVQTFDSKARRSLGRIASQKKVISTLVDLTEIPRCSVNVELMYGLPKQNEEDVINDLKTLEVITDLHGLDLYHTKTFPNCPFPIATEKGAFARTADIKTKEEMYRVAAQWLGRTDYRQLSTCHWIRDQRERSLYKRLAEGPAEIIPFGSGAGGKLQTLDVFQVPRLEDYFRLISAGLKPLAVASTRNGDANLKDQLSYDLGEGYLSSETEEKLLEVNPSIENVMQRWTEKGYFQLALRSERKRKLSLRGRFRSSEMIDFISKKLAKTSEMVN